LEPSELPGKAKQYFHSY